MLNKSDENREEDVIEDTVDTEPIYFSLRSNTADQPNAGPTFEDSDMLAAANYQALQEYAGYLDEPTLEKEDDEVYTSLSHYFHNIIYTINNPFALLFLDCSR